MGVVFVRGPLAGLEYNKSTISGSDASFRYVVASDDENDGPETLAKDGRLPRLFTQYRVGNDHNPNLLLHSIRWKHLGRNLKKGWRTVYEATFNYGAPNFSTNDPGEDPENPNPPSEIDSFSFSSTWEVIKVPLIRDINGARICNSAGDDFTRPVEEDKRIKINRLTRRENINPNPKAEEYTNTVNAFPIWGGDVGTWLMEILVSGDGGEAGWTVDYNMRHRPEGWDAEILDQGRNYMDGFEKYPITDSEGMEVTEPRLLDGFGGQLAEGADPVYRKYETKVRKDFLLLKIPHWTVL